MKIRHESKHHNRKARAYKQTLNKRPNSEPALCFYLKEKISAPKLRRGYRIHRKIERLQYVEYGGVKVLTTPVSFSRYQVSAFVRQRVYKNKIATLVNKLGTITKDNKNEINRITRALG